MTTMAFFDWMAANINPPAPAPEPKENAPRPKARVTDETFGFATALETACGPIKAPQSLPHCPGSAWVPVGEDPEPERQSLVQACGGSAPHIHFFQALTASAGSAPVAANVAAPSAVAVVAAKPDSSAALVGVPRLETVQNVEAALMSDAMSPAENPEPRGLDPKQARGRAAPARHLLEAVFASAEQRSPPSGAAVPGHLSAALPEPGHSAPAPVAANIAAPSAVAVVVAEPDRPEAPVGVPRLETVQNVEAALMPDAMAPGENPKPQGLDPKQPRGGAAPARHWFEAVLTSAEPPSAPSGAAVTGRWPAALPGRAYSVPPSVAGDGPAPAAGAAEVGGSESLAMPPSGAAVEMAQRVQTALMPDSNVSADEPESEGQVPVQTHGQSAPSLQGLETVMALTGQRVPQDDAAAVRPSASPAVRRHNPPSPVLDKGPAPTVEADTAQADFSPPPVPPVGPTPAADDPAPPLSANGRHRPATAVRVHAYQPVAAPVMAARSENPAVPVSVPTVAMAQGTETALMEKAIASLNAGKKTNSGSSEPASGQQPAAERLMAETSLSTATEKQSSADPEGVIPKDEQAVGPPIPAAMPAIASGPEAKMGARGLGQAAKTMARPLTGPAEPVVTQMVHKAALALTNGSLEMRIELQPEFLGPLKIRVVTENHRVALKIVAAFPVVKELIEGQIHQLKSDLGSHGLQIDHVDVSVQRDGGGYPEGQRERDTLPNRENGTAQEPPAGQQRRQGKKMPRPLDSFPGQVGIDYFA
jgi:hypothetical protein